MKTTPLKGTGPRRTAEAHTARRGANLRSVACLRHLSVAPVLGGVFVRWPAPAAKRCPQQLARIVCSRWRSRISLGVAIVAIAILLPLAPGAEAASCGIGDLWACGLEFLVTSQLLICGTHLGGDLTPGIFAELNSLVPEEVGFLENGRARKCSFAAGALIEEEGNPVSGIIGIVGGWACRMRLLSDGRRQIVGFVLPGDILDWTWSRRKHVRLSVMALTTVDALVIPKSAIGDIPERCPNLNAALLKQAWRNYAILAEHTVRLGRRTAVEKVAHLLLEIHHRLDAVHHCENGCFVLEATQEELADTLGLSTVHINRTLKFLREQGLITVHGRLVALRDTARLAELAQFGPEYLEYSAAQGGAGREDVS